MTLGLAWRNGKGVFLICDSVTSSAKKVVEGFSSFGEAEGRYGQTYYIKETSKKIIKIPRFGFVSYSGDEKRALEAVDFIKVCIEHKTLIEIVDLMKTSFNSTEDSFELLIICCIDADNKIFHFESENFMLHEIQDIKMIGSAEEISGFKEQLVSYILNMNTNLNEKMYFADVLTSIQCASLKYNDTFLFEGVGGFYWGGYIQKDGNMRWAPDVTYFLKNKKTEWDSVSVYDWEDFALVTSGITNQIKLFGDGVEDKTRSKGNSEKVLKVANTRVPYALIWYDRDINVKQIDVIDGISMTADLYFRQIRTTHVFSELKIEKNRYYPNYLSKQYAKKSYFSEGYIVEHPALFEKDVMTLIEEKIEFNGREVRFDPPFEVELNIWSKARANKFYRLLKNSLESHEYENIIFIDSQYLAKEINQRKFALKQFDIKREWVFNMEFLIGNQELLADRAFDKLLFIVYNRKNFKANRFYKIISREWEKYSNIKHFHDEGDQGIAFHVLFLLRFYYMDEKFFHLDKLIFVADSDEVALALELAPYNNTNWSGEESEIDEEAYSRTDIILCRNYNSDTKMDGRFMYFPLDLNIWHCFGLNSSEIFTVERLFEKYLYFRKSRKVL